MKKPATQLPLWGITAKPSTSFKHWRSKACCQKQTKNGSQKSNSPCAGTRADETERMSRGMCRQRVSRPRVSQCASDDMAGARTFLSAATFEQIETLAKSNAPIPFRVAADKNVDKNVRAPALLACTFTSFLLPLLILSPVHSADSATPLFEWRTGSPASQGFSPARLEALQKQLAVQRTKAFLVIRNDTIVHEWYSADHGPDKKHGTASLAKALVGGVSTA